MNLTVEAGKTLPITIALPTAAPDRSPAARTPDGDARSGVPTAGRSRTKSARTVASTSRAEIRIVR